MIKVRKWLITVGIIFIIVMLTACSGETKPEEMTVLSDALDSYTLWFKVNSESKKLTKDATVDTIFQFENGQVKKFKTGWLTVDELVHLSDDEIITASIEHLKDTEVVYEEPDFYDYTLDITLDENGETVKFINIETEPETLVSVIGEAVHQKINGTTYSGLAAIRKENSDTFTFLITRVEENNVALTLDDIDSKKSIVTIGKAAQFQAERDQRLEETLLEIDKSLPPEIRYKQSCASCHAEDLSGFYGPPLDKVGSRLSEEEIYDIIINGRGEMPSGTVREDYIAEQLAKWLSEMK